MYIVNELYDDVDVAREFEQELPPDFKGLCRPACRWRADTAEGEVDRLLGRPRVAALWENANRVAHEQLIAIVEDKNAGLTH